MKSSVIYLIITLLLAGAQVSDYIVFHKKDGLFQVVQIDYVGEVGK